MRTRFQYFPSRGIPPATSAVALIAVVAVSALAGVAGGGTRAARATDPAVTSVYPISHPHGLMVTSGGWAYCEQVRALARRTHYTLLCGRYSKDGYLGPGLRSQR